MYRFIDCDVFLVIKPRIPVKPSKSDPVALYHHYQAEWKKMTFPGEDNRANLRWAIREKMLGDHNTRVRSTTANATVFTFFTCLSKYSSFHQFFSVSICSVMLINKFFQSVDHCLLVLRVHSARGSRRWLDIMRKILYV